MSERSIISTEEARLAAKNIAVALKGDESSPVNPEYISGSFELALEEDDVWLTMMSMMNLLSESHGELLTEKSIHVEVVVLTEYLSSIRFKMLEKMALENAEDEVGGLMVLATPIVRELRDSGNKVTADLILKNLSELLEHPFDAAMSLYTNLQIAQSMDEASPIYTETTRKNLEELYKIITELVHSAMEAKMNHDWKK